MLYLHVFFSDFFSVLNEDSDLIYRTHDCFQKNESKKEKIEKLLSGPTSET